MAIQFLLDLLTGNLALVNVPSGKHNSVGGPSIVGANAALTLLGP